MQNSATEMENIGQNTEKDRELENKTPSEINHIDKLNQMTYVNNTVIVPNENELKDKAIECLKMSTKTDIPDPELIETITLNVNIVRPTNLEATNTEGVNSLLDGPCNDVATSLAPKSTNVFLLSSKKQIEDDVTLENGLPPRATNALTRNEKPDEGNPMENEIPARATYDSKTNENRNEDICMESGLTPRATISFPINKMTEKETIKNKLPPTGTTVFAKNKTPEDGDTIENGLPPRATNGFRTNESTDVDIGLDNGVPPRATNSFPTNQKIDDDLVIENGRPPMAIYFRDNLSSRESTTVLSSRTIGSGSSVTRRRPTIDVEPGQSSPYTTVDIDDEEEKRRKIPHFKRRKIYNIIKHVVSILLIMLDVTFDWIEYTEMNTRETYQIVAERQIDNKEFTYECEGSGETIQYVYMIFTIVGTVLSVGQVGNILYQTVYEIKNTNDNKRIVHEYVETFVFLFFIAISQILLIMGFFDVCKLDCEIETTELFLVINSVISFLRLSWRWFSSCKCCTVYWKSPTLASTRPHTPRAESSNDTCYCSGLSNMLLACVLVILFPLFLPFLPFVGLYCLLKECSGKCCSCDVCNKRVNTSESTRHAFKCEQPCKCCILRCFPSRFEDPDTEACECICKDCMACEQSCKCFLCRCFPSVLPSPKDDICKCLCGECMNCENNCRCCILRCFPSYLVPPKDEFCTCRCGDCLACEHPCKCFTIRCWPSHLTPPKDDICTCRCGDCMASELPCKCFTFRCCPSHLNPPQEDVWTCSCRECMTRELPCRCFTCRCFPTYLNPPKSDIWTCSCRECLAYTLPCKCFIFRCFPEHLKSPHPDICTCLCSQCLSCKLPCPCFTFRCFPGHQGEEDWLTCTCGKCLSCERSCGCCICRVCPGKLIPPKDNVIDCTCSKCLACEKNCPCCTCRCFPELLEKSKWCECKKINCCNKPVAIISQPIPTPVQIPLVPSPPPPPRKNCCSNCVYFLVAVALLFTGLLYLIYASLIVVQLQYVLLCTVNDTIMETTQVVFVRNFVKLFQL